MDPKHLNELKNINLSLTTLGNERLSIGFMLARQSDRESLCGWKASADTIPRVKADKASSG
jgi:hypothetical protein